MTETARDWGNLLIAVPKSLQAQEPYRRLMQAERRAADAERELTVSQREVLRQAHLIAMILDQVGGEVTLTADTMVRFDAHRTIRTQMNLMENSLRVWMEES